MPPKHGKSASIANDKAPPMVPSRVAERKKEEKQRKKSSIINMHKESKRITAVKTQQQVTSLGSLSGRDACRLYQVHSD